MKKLIFTLFILIFTLGFTENIPDEVNTLETLPDDAAIKQENAAPKTTPRTTAPKTTPKATTKQTAKEEAIPEEPKGDKAVSTKVTLKLKISKNIPAIKNGDVAVSIYEYDPLLADYPADEVFYNDYSIKHAGRADTVKTFNVTIKRTKGKKYYAVIEVIDNKTLEVYRAKSTKDDIGKILEPGVAGQVFVVDDEE
ncbi:hypothetical protein [Sebaldella sp. S0638]|uniref:hypothetical protein n=1 Tax=Sebaldella sp. S0638 TaxID=2957809 RepID=UPI00209FBE92|nr:hypothetical protein [Sebaldella sp. S0638]MCP1225071.1 hypothetical protein [Sebaldella sp. S0638]